jgi:hypothetical protein
MYVQAVNCPMKPPRPLPSRAWRPAVSRLPRDHPGAYSCPAEYGVSVRKLSPAANEYLFSWLRVRERAGGPAGPGDPVLDAA